MMKKKDMKSIRSEECTLFKDGISVVGLDKSDEYRARIWNSIIDIEDTRSLALLADNALILSWKEHEEAKKSKEIEQHPEEQ